MSGIFDLVFLFTSGKDYCFVNVVCANSKVKIKENCSNSQKWKSSFGPKDFVSEERSCCDIEYYSCKFK